MLMKEYRLWWLIPGFQKVLDNEDLKQISQKITTVVTLKIKSCKTQQSVSPVNRFFFGLILAMSCVNFDVCSIALVMYLLNGVPFPIFVLIRDYFAPLSVDGFPNATALFSLSFEKKMRNESNHVNWGTD